MRLDDPRKQFAVTTSDDTRNRILAAARRSFLDNGYVGTKTRNVAKDAQTSESRLFHYFESKYALLTAVYNESWKALNDFIAKSHDLDHEEDPRDALIATVVAYWKFYDADPETSSFLIINTGNTDSLLVEHLEKATISEENRKYLGLIEDLTRRAAQRGLLGGVSPRAMAEGLLGLSEGVMLGWYLFDHAADGDYASKITIAEAETMLRKLLA